MERLGIFSYAFNAVSPILLLVLLGYMLKKKRVFSEDFFKKLNKLAFDYCFAPMMFLNIYSIKHLGDIEFNFSALLMFVIVVITVVSFILASILTNRKERKGVLIQAGFRSNFAIIGLPLVEGLVGAEAVVIAAAAQAPTIFYFNIVSVLCFAMYSKSAKIEPKRIALGIVKNPMIQGIAAAIVCLIIREMLPTDAEGNPVFTIQKNMKWLYTTLTYLNRIGTPLCLIALGGLFNITDVPDMKKEIAAGTLMRLVMAPVIGFAISFAAQEMAFITLTPTHIGIFVAVFGAPVAISSAAMASQMDADDVLAGQIVIWTCIFSMVTVFAMSAGFRAVGLL